MVNTHTVAKDAGAKGSSPHIEQRISQHLTVACSRSNPTGVRWVVGQWVQKFSHAKTPTSSGVLLRFPPLSGTQRPFSPTRLTGC